MRASLSSQILRKPLFLLARTWGNLRLRPLCSSPLFKAAFENVAITTARWVHCENAKKLEQFREKNACHLAIDAAGELVYLAPSRVNLQLAQERAPDVRFAATREHASTATLVA